MKLYGNEHGRLIELRRDIKGRPLIPYSFTSVFNVVSDGVSRTSVLSSAEYILYTTRYSSLT